LKKTAEVHKLYTSSNIIRVIKSRRMEWAENVASMGKMISTYKILVGKHERKRPLEKPRSRCEENIRMDLTAMWCKGVDWMHVAQVRDQWRALVDTIMNLLVP
jgi:hypothetical protein